MHSSAKKPHLIIPLLFVSVEKLTGWTLEHGYSTTVGIENDEKEDGVGLAAEAEGVGDLLEVENTLLPFTAAKGELADAYDMNPPYEMDVNRHSWV